MTDRDTDLMRLHAMAIKNTPKKTSEYVESMNAYIAHRNYCIERYGCDEAYRAEQYGHLPELVESKGNTTNE